MTQRTDDPKINGANVIGVVGGMDIPLINANIAGYIAGAKYVNPSVDVRYSYVGDWADPARGKELAQAIDQGVDIIWAAAGRSGLGVIQAAQERNVYAIGADSDQGHLAPEHILTNGMKFVNNTVFLAVRQVLEGAFQGGIHVLGVAEGGLGYSESLVPADIRARVDELAARIVAGELVPPETIDAVDAWLAREPVTPGGQGAVGISPAASGAYAVRMRGIVKRFDPVVANDRVDLDVLPGEIHGLLGGERRREEHAGADPGRVDR